MLLKGIELGDCKLELRFYFGFSTAVLDVSGLGLKLWTEFFVFRDSSRADIR